MKLGRKYFFSFVARKIYFKESQIFYTRNFESFDAQAQCSLIPRKDYANIISTLLCRPNLSVPCLVRSTTSKLIVLVNLNPKFEFLNFELRIKHGTIVT